jgi:hypothetical protein
MCKSYYCGAWKPSACLRHHAPRARITRSSAQHTLPQRREAPARNSPRPTHYKCTTCMRNAYGPKQATAPQLRRRQTHAQSPPHTCAQMVFGPILQLAQNSVGRRQPADPTHPSACLPVSAAASQQQKSIHLSTSSRWPAHDRGAVNSWSRMKPMSAAVGPSLGATSSTRCRCRRAASQSPVM